MPAAPSDRRRVKEDSESQPAEGATSATFRRLPAWLALAVPATAFALAVFHLYTGAFGALPNIQQRAPHVGLCLILALLLISPGRRLDGSRIV